MKKVRIQILTKKTTRKPGNHNAAQLRREMLLSLLFKKKITQLSQSKIYTEEAAKKLSAR